MAADQGLCSHSPFAPSRAPCEAKARLPFLLCLFIKPIQNTFPISHPLPRRGGITGSRPDITGSGQTWDRSVAQSSKSVHDGSQVFVFCQFVGLPEVGPNWEREVGVGPLIHVASTAWLYHALCAEVRSPEPPLMVLNRLCLNTIVLTTSRFRVTLSHVLHFLIRTQSQKLDLPRWPSEVHSKNSNCPTSCGLTH